MIDHASYGVHSGIPLCCVTFFVEDWDKRFETFWRKSAYSKAVDDGGWNYVPCPECFRANRKVDMVICEFDCMDKCWNKFKY